MYRVRKYRKIIQVLKSFSLYTRFAWYAYLCLMYGKV